MRMTDLVVDLQRRRQIKAPGVAAEETRQRSIAHKARLAAKVAEERERLTPEDQMVARLTQLPAKRADRVAMANDLRTTASGRKRTIREVAAIMGVSLGATKDYFTNPEKPVGSAGKSERRLPSRSVIERKAQPMVAFGRTVHRKRKRIGITQAALAQESGVARERIAAIENGEDPLVSEVVALTDTLDSLC